MYHIFFSWKKHTHSKTWKECYLYEYVRYFCYPLYWFAFVVKIVQNLKKTKIIMACRKFRKINFPFFSSKIKIYIKFFPLFYPVDGKLTKNISLRPYIISLYMAKIWDFIFVHKKLNWFFTFLFFDFNCVHFVLFDPIH